MEVFINKVIPLIKYTLVAIFILLFAACSWIDPNNSTSVPQNISDLAQTATALTAQLSGNNLAETATAISLQLTALSNPSSTPLPPELTPEFPIDTPEPTSTGDSNHEDIPIVPGEILNLFQTDNLVTYTSPLIYDETVKFYETAMPAAGWQRIELGSYVASSVAEIIFRKDTREAQILIRENPLNSQSYVVITIK